jgi:HPt (histidine-containing phosphotransfer) domain-containing protein
MFLKDTTYELLSSSLANGDTQEAFRAAHTMKGMCQNLSLSQLYTSSSQLTEMLRNGGTMDASVDAMAEAVKADYEKTVACIHALD